MLELPAVISRTRSPGLGGAPAQLTNAGGTIHYSMFGSLQQVAAGNAVLE